MTAFLFALLAGAVTVAGPCILPLLPVILGTSTVKRHPARPLFIILGFILAFSGSAILFSAFGRTLNISSESWRSAAAVLIGLFGLMLLFPKFQESIFSRIGRLTTKLVPRQTNITEGGLLSGFILGLSLGLIWTPCAGPVLGSILTLVAANQNIAQTAGLLIAYSIGAGLPMIAIAYGGQAAIARVQSLAKYTVAIQRAFGALTILIAIGLFTGYDRYLLAYLLEKAPWLFLNQYFNI